MSRPSGRGPGATTIRTPEDPFELLAWVVPVAILGLGGAAAALVAFGLESAIATSVTWLPVDPADLDPLDAITAALALSALAIGMARRKRLAWGMAVVAFGAAGVAQALTFSHPAGAAVSVVCIVLLASDRTRYGAGTGRAGRRAITVVAFAALGLLVLDSALGDLLSGTWQQPIADLRGLIGAIADGLSFSAFTGVFRPAAAIRGLQFLGPDPAGGLFDLLELGARAALLLAAVAILGAVSERPPARQVIRRARLIARRYGRGALLPFQIGQEVRHFLLWGSQGLVAYGQAGRMAVALGDPLGPPAQAWETFGAFLSTREEMDQIAAVYQASASSRGRLATFGFRSIRIGMEAIVEVADFSLEGPRRANLRRTVARAERGGIQIRWFPDGVHGRSGRRIRVGLEGVDRAWRIHAGAQLRFTIHSWAQRDLRRRDVALAVASESEGRISAFATFRPTGTDGGWVLDLIRRAPDATPGAVESCIVEAARELGRSGAASLSLGLAPLYGLDRAAPSGEERFLACLGRLVRPFYDVAGLAFFKAKFDPRWEPRYVAVRGRLDLLRLGPALLRLHLAGSGAGPMDAVAAILRAIRVRATLGDTVRPRAGPVTPS